MMKKIAFALLVIALCSVAKAEDLSLTSVTTTLLDHVHGTTLIDADGKTRGLFLDGIVRAASYKGDHLFEVQAGFSGNTKPQAGEANSANVVICGFLRIDPFLKDLFFPNWTFLKALEHGATYVYDFREHSRFYGYQIGLAFGLSPQL